MTETTTQDRPRVVVGVDRSPAAKAAIVWAKSYADLIDATLEFVAAWEPITASYGWTYISDTADETQNVAVNGLASVVDAALPDGRPAGSTFLVGEGHPAQVLNDASQGARCVVLGSRGHSGLAGMMLGSVSAAVSAHAACPVVVVHEGD